MFIFIFAQLKQAGKCFTIFLLNKDKYSELETVE